MDVRARIDQIIRQPRAARHDDAVKFERGLSALEDFIGKHLNFEQVLRPRAPRGCRKQHRAERDEAGPKHCPPVLGAWSTRPPDPNGPRDERDLEDQGRKTWDQGTD